MSSGRACALVCALVLGLMGLAAGGAHAALPAPGEHHLAHHHETRGDGWHIELTVSSDPHWVGELVLHSERCNATVLTTRVRIRDDGSIASSKPFTAAGGRQGRWRLNATFGQPGHLEGELHVTTPSCDGGVRRFHTHTGASNHDHGGGGGHAHHQHVAGTPPGRYPNLRRASAASRAKALRLWQATLRAAKSRFPSARSARALGYVPQALKRRPVAPPMLFHLRNRSYDHDRRSFDARHVEALVYWWNADGERVLVAFMYRLPFGAPTSFAAPLFGWHRHGPRASQMTHVWLTGDLRSALANCMPVAALQRAIPKLRFEPRGASTSPESKACPTR